MSALVESIYDPPEEATVNRAIADYARAVRDAYGDRVQGIYLFGSRARGDHTPASDADIAVVLADEDWDFWKELNRLVDLEYDFVVESGADIQAWPVRESEWRRPEIQKTSALLAAMHRDARRILVNVE